MSESNNNIPMRITQLEEATSYPEGSYIPLAKAGWGTKKVDVNLPTPPQVKTNDLLGIDINKRATLIDGKFINATNNAIADSSGFSLTEPIEVKKGQIVKLTAIGYSNVTGMIATCNEDNTSRTTVCTSAVGVDTYLYEILEDGYICCSFWSTDYKLEIYINYYDLYRESLTLQPYRAGTKSVNIQVHSTGFINATNNQYAESSNFYLSESIELLKDQTIVFNGAGYSTVVGIINLYDAINDTYETVCASENGVQTYTYTAVKNCLVRLSYARDQAASATITTNNDGFGKIDYIEAEIEELKDNNNYSVEYPYLFNNIIFIGDSLTYGHDGQQRLEKNYPFYFGKMIDAEISNQGLSGRTAKEWWDEIGSSYSHFADFDCAIIYLGTNGGLTDTVSTDCKVDYTQNTDNNTGDYGKIIGKIKADAPNCKIFCVAGPNEYITRKTTMNPAVRSLAEFYEVGLLDLENCILSDNGSSTSASRYLYRPNDGIHYDILGYFTFANMIFDYMKEYISEHLPKYKN